MADEEHPHSRIVIDFGFRAVVLLTSQRNSGYATVNSCVVREYVIGQYMKGRGEDSKERMREGGEKERERVYRNMDGGFSDKAVMLDRSKCSR